MPALRDVGEGAAYTGVGGMVVWMVNKLRQITNDTEARAGRRIDDVEASLERAEGKAREAIGRAEACEEREHRLRLELIDAGVDIPVDAPDP